MESLERLTNECIILLHKNKLLRPLIRSQITQNILSKVQIDNELKEKTITEFKENIKVSDEKELNAWLAKNDMSEAEFQDLALADCRLKKYCKEEFSHNVEAHFLERKNQLDIVVYSLIRMKNFYKAREMYLRILEKEADFGDIATSFSEGIENTTRGLIGPVPLEQAHPTIVNKLRNGKPGEIQPPIEIDGSYVILRLESLDIANLDDFMRGKMTIELFNKRVDSKTDELNANLLNRSKNI